jgi:hypothetical protein
LRSAFVFTESLWVYLNLGCPAPGRARAPHPYDQSRPYLSVCGIIYGCRCLKFSFCVPLTYHLFIVYYWIETGGNNIYIKFTHEPPMDYIECRKTYRDVKLPLYNQDRSYLIFNSNIFCAIFLIPIITIFSCSSLFVRGAELSFYMYSL